MDSKLIKGQAWIIGDSLVQDQTLILSNGTTSENTVYLIKDIWADLRGAGTYKSNDKKTYFYWEYQMTDPDNDDLEINVRIECPRPKDGMYEAPYDQAPTGDWETYWLGQYKKVAARYEEAYAIQKKQIIFPGTQYIDSKGNIVEVEEKKVDNDDIGDITNLLGMF